MKKLLFLFIVLLATPLHADLPPKTPEDRANELTKVQWFLDNETSSPVYRVLRAIMIQNFKRINEVREKAGLQKLTPQEWKIEFMQILNSQEAD